MACLQRPPPKYVSGHTDSTREACDSSYPRDDSQLYSAKKTAPTKVRQRPRGNEADVNVVNDAVAWVEHSRHTGGDVGARKGRVRSLRRHVDPHGGHDRQRHIQHEAFGHIAPVTRSRQPGTHSVRGSFEESHASPARTTTCHARTRMHITESGPQWRW